MILPKQSVVSDETISENAKSDNFLEEKTSFPGATHTRITLTLLDATNNENHCKYHLID